jgi:hypothetical protein
MALRIQTPPRLMTPLDYEEILTEEDQSHSRRIGCDVMLEFQQVCVQGLGESVFFSLGLQHFSKTITDPEPHVQSPRQFVKFSRQFRLPTRRASSTLDVEGALENEVFQAGTD